MNIIVNKRNIKDRRNNRGVCITCHKPIKPNEGRINYWGVAERKEHIKCWQKHD